VEVKLERLRPLVRRVLHEAALLGLDARAVKRLLGDEAEALRPGASESGLVARGKKG
jgi:hypothetical protein